MDALRLHIAASSTQERGQLHHLVSAIQDLPLEITTSDDLEQASAACAHRDLDVVLMCRTLLVEDSLDSCTRFLAGEKPPLLILVDRQDDEAGSLRLVRQGAQDCISMDRLSTPGIEKILLQAMYRRRAEQDALRLRGDLERRVEERVRELDMANLALRREVDERRKAEKDLRESETRYRTLVESTGEGIGVLDLEHRFLFANRAAEALFAVPHGLVGHRLEDFISPEQWDKVASLAKGGTLEEATSTTLDILRHDGLPRTLLATISTRQSDSGVTLGVFGIFRDITEELIHEQDLRRRIAFEDLLVRVSSTFLLATEDSVDSLMEDALGQIGAFSGVDRAYLFRFSEGTSCMSNTHEWCAPEIQPEKENLQDLPTEIFPAWMDMLLHNRLIYIPCVAELPPEWEAERQILEPQGIQSLVVVPLTIDGKLAGFIGFDSVRQARLWSDEDHLLLRFMADNIGLTIRNVEQQRATRLATEEAHSQTLAAEAANRTKSLFLANMSHEIRTPMNAILGFTQMLLRDPALTPHQAGHLDTIARSGMHLLRLIDDVLDMSKIEAGRLTLRSAPLHFGDFLGDLVATLQGRADNKGLELVLHPGIALPLYIMADEGKLRQILVNLMGNAIKFTQKGRVTLSVHENPLSGGVEGHALTFEVRDTGPGISSQDQAKLFSLFQQGSSGERSGGTGLGLAISAKLAGLMGGEIRVSSEEGKGSTFVCTVIVGTCEELPEPAGEKIQVMGLDPASGAVKVLVVDDEANNRVLLCELLRPLGFEVLEACNGQEAVALFNQWSPQAVLMDMRMPEMDGYEATRLIRQSEAGRKVFIMAVTASAFDDDRRLVLASGVDAYFRKPFNQDELVAVLGRGLGLRYLVVDPQDPQAMPASSLVISEAPMMVLGESLDEETRRSMLEAVREGDMRRLSELVQQWAPSDRDGAEALLRMVDRYDYEALEASLDPRINSTSPNR